MEQDGEAQQHAQAQQLDSFLAQFGDLVLWDVAAMAAYQQGHHLLVLAGEARQVGVLDQVGAVLVVMVVGDIQADFVHFRRPAQ